MHDITRHNVLNFKSFMERCDCETVPRKDIKKTLNKLPKSHKDLVRGFEINYTNGNTIEGDKKHIGTIHKRKIVVAAPWNYGREFTTLHEIAHMVWEYKVDPGMRKEWNKIAKDSMSKNKDLRDENPLELFCMAYAQHYAKNKITKFEHPKWHEFIEKIPN